MLLSIRHLTTYTYDQPVMLQPHCLRLTPRAGSYDALLESALTINPTPSSMSTSIESDGSISHWVMFKEEAKQFSVESRNLVRLLADQNPFGFLVCPESCLKLPMAYPTELSRELQVFMTGGKIAPTVRDFAFDVLAEANGNTMDFLVLLSQCMKRNFVYEFRHAGGPYQPYDTLAARRGSCRDWAILYMAAARAVGLAARFVSGYYFDEKPGPGDLHAWAEVYVPGGGWRGFDPSLGLACYGHHIALTSSAYPGLASPIQGSFNGYAHAAMKLDLGYQYLPEDQHVS